MGYTPPFANGGVAADTRIQSERQGDALSQPSEWQE
jgi:hypothetical protein